MVWPPYVSCFYHPAAETIDLHLHPQIYFLLHRMDFSLILFHFSWLNSPPYRAWYNWLHCRSAGDRSLVGDLIVGSSTQSEAQGSFLWLHPDWPTSVAILKQYAWSTLLPSKNSLIGIPAAYLSIRSGLIVPYLHHLGGELQSPSTTWLLMHLHPLQEFFLHDIPPLLTTFLHAEVTQLLSGLISAEFSSLLIWLRLSTLV